VTGDSAPQAPLHRALDAGGRRRTFTVTVPRAALAEPAPLVLVLHGNHPGATGQQMRDWTSFDAQAEAFGYVVAYPDGVSGSWADGRGVTRADEAGVDDVAFLRALIDWSAHEHGTVADRAVVAGLSNGAFMAHRLAFEAGDRVAVIAAVAGCLPAALAERAQREPGFPAYAVSALLVHGTADTLAPIGGGYSRHRGPNGELRARMLSLDESAACYRAVDRCPPEACATSRHAASHRSEATGGVGGTGVAAWTVLGGGHAWPGMAVPPSWGQYAGTEFDTARELCRFASTRLIPAAARRIGYR
jgi:polyhydroxybutyrate depolymerase